MLTAFRPLDKTMPGLTVRYLSGWDIEDCDEQSPDYGKVLLHVRTRKEAQAIVDSQKLPALAEIELEGKR